MTSAARIPDLLHEGPILLEREPDGGEVPAKDHQIKLGAGPAQSSQGLNVQVVEEMVQDVVGKALEGRRRWQLLPSSLDFLLLRSATVQD